MERVDLLGHRNRRSAKLLQERRGRDEQVGFLEGCAAHSRIGRAGGVVGEESDEVVRGRGEVEERERDFHCREHSKAGGRDGV